MKIMKSIILKISKDIYGEDKPYNEFVNVSLRKYCTLKY